MGDFNAGCSYINQGQWACIRDENCTDTVVSLWDPAKYMWLLDDSTDTSVAAESCPYDRFVATLSIVDAVMAARVIDVEGDFGLSPSEMSTLSDHYPIEVILDTDAAFTSTLGSSLTNPFIFAPFLSVSISIVLI